MSNGERRATGSWDRLFILVLVFILLCLAWNLGHNSMDEKEAILLQLDALHHEHCENDADCDHKHGADHYHSAEHMMALEHAKEHERLKQLLENKSKYIPHEEGMHHDVP